MGKLPENLQKTLDLIPSGEINAISREELRLIRGQHDRLNRLNINELRKLGYPICVSENGGYFMGQSPTDILRTVADYRARARECFVIANRLEQVARRLSQEGLF